MAVAGEESAALRVPENCGGNFVSLESLVGSGVAWIDGDGKGRKEMKKKRRGRGIVDVR